MHCLLLRSSLDGLKNATTIVKKKIKFPTPPPKKTGNKYASLVATLSNSFSSELPSLQSKKGNRNHTNTSNLKNQFGFILQQNSKMSLSKRKHSFI